MTAIYLARSRDKNGGIHTTVRFAFDETVVTLLKDIPANGRSYDPVTRIWTIKHDLYLIDFAQAAFAFGHTFTDPDGCLRAAGVNYGRSAPPPNYGQGGAGGRASGSGYTPPRAAPVASQPWAKALFDALPSALHDRAYRALAKVLHPDTGGDAEMMKALNAERDRRSR